MATSLLALIDDIAGILDDVALMSKIAAKKTAGVLGDDLALNAQQVAGVTAERELPVVWAVGVGSLRNKAILVPARWRCWRTRLQALCCVGSGANHSGSALTGAAAGLNRHKN